MNGEELMKLKVEDRIAYLIGSTPDYESRINNALDKIVEYGSANERIKPAFQNRVERYFAEPSGTFGGDGLAHLPQGYPTSTITQEEYQKLSAVASGLAAKILADAGFVEQAKPAVDRYGQMKLEIDF